jgi:hypothetical protein
MVGVVGSNPIAPTKYKADSVDFSTLSAFSFGVLAAAGMKKV